MRNLKSNSVLFLFAFLTGSVACNVAWADRGHRHSGVRVGVYLGGPAFFPWYYPSPFFYGSNYYGSSYYGSNYYGSSYYGSSYYGPSTYGPAYYGPSYTYGNPTIVTTPAPAPVYIEQRNAVSPSQNSNYWYYCNNPDGYYPYVKDCNSGWQQVAPRSTPSQ